MRAFAVIALAAALVPSAPAQTVPAWQQHVQAHHQKLLADNGPGTDAALRAELLTMGADDQDAHGIDTSHPADKSKPALAPNVVEIDGQLTAKLHDIVAAHGWPTIHLVGYDASQAAMLVLIHSPDHAWQRELIPKLETLAQDDKIDGSQLALAIDKELVAAGKPQRYGTQFKFVDGQAMMYAVEDSAHLDRRREQAMLPPLSVYKKMLGDMYHVPVSDMIIRADAN